MNKIFIFISFYLLGSRPLVIAGFSVSVVLFVTVVILIINISRKGTLKF